MGVLEVYRDRICTLISEPDKGIFDGINKGISRVSGESDDIVHFLSADDQYGDPFVIRDVMDAFRADSTIDACYGDQIYTNSAGRIVRFWKAGRSTRFKLSYGWLPPHMTFFVRKHVYERFGTFDLRYSISADQDFMLRVLHTHRIHSKYLNRVLVNMAPGGHSGRSISTIVRANLEMAEIWRNNGLPFGMLVATLKPVRKLAQLVSRPPHHPHVHWR